MDSATADLMDLTPLSDSLSACLPSGQRPLHLTYQLNHQHDHPLNQPPKQQPLMNSQSKTRQIWSSLIERRVCDLYSQSKPLLNAENTTTPTRISIYSGIYAIVQSEFNAAIDVSLFYATIRQCRLEGRLRSVESVKNESACCPFL